MLAGGIIIAIMIMPIITSVSREILRSVPNLQREAAYALGATRWEVTRIAVLSYAKKGIFGAVILGLGRALGETMAVTMVIGNTPQIAASLFAPGYTLASVIANEFTEATTDLYLECAVRNRTGAFWHHHSGQSDRATASENDSAPHRPRAPCNELLRHEQSSMAKDQERAGFCALDSLAPCS